MEHTSFVHDTTSVTMPCLDDMSRKGIAISLIGSANFQSKLKGNVVKFGSTTVSMAGDMFVSHTNRHSISGFDAFCPDSCPEMGMIY